MSKLFSSDRKSQTMPAMRCNRASLMQTKIHQFNTMEASLTLNIGNTRFMCTANVTTDRFIFVILLKEGLGRGGKGYNSYSGTTPFNKSMREGRNILT